MATGFNSLKESTQRPVSSLSLLAEELSESACISEEHSASSNQNNPGSEVLQNSSLTYISSCTCPNKSSLLLSPSISSSPPCIPPKRHCDSLSKEQLRSLQEKSPLSGLARPIPVRPTLLTGDCTEIVSTESTILSASTPSECTSSSIDSGTATTPGSKGNSFFSRSASFGHSSKCSHRYYSRIHSFGHSKLQLLPYAKSRSAFTPTRPIISPRASSDYSLSPEIDSPLQRPASVQSSGFHEENPFQSLIETSSLPDCSEFLTPNSSSRIRSNSQPNLNPSPSISAICSQCCALLTNKKSLFKPLPMKRRRDVTIGSFTPLNSTNPAPIGSSNLCSAPLEQIKNQLVTTRSPDVFYFSSSRPYLVSLAHLPCSPPVPPNTRRSGKFGKPSTILEHVPMSSSGGRGSQASTLTASSTGTPTNSRENMLQAFSQSGELASDQVEESCRSSSLDLDSSMNYEMEYSRDQVTDYSRDDPEDSLLQVSDNSGSLSNIFRPVVLADSATISSTAQLHPFQEIDLDLIEND